MNTQPTVLRATSSADFLAALPRLHDMTTPESLFIVLFKGITAVGMVRTNLPPLEKIINPDDRLQDWFHTVVKITLQGEEAALVVNTDAALSRQPVSSPHGKLANTLANLIHTADTSVRDVLVVASDGWASFVEANFPRLHSLDEITSSPLYEPEHKALSLDQWRAQHPELAVETPEEVISIARDTMARLRASESKGNPS